MRFKWTRSHEIYIPELDGEHREIYELAERLRIAVQKGEAVGPIVRELVTTIASHFEHEERLMRSTACLSFSWHKKQHDHARSAAGALMARIEAGDPDATGEMLTFLGSWLKAHVSVSDRIMSAHVRLYKRSRAAA